MDGSQAIAIIDRIGISKAAFARLIGVTPMAVNKWRNGHPPSGPVAAILRLLDARPELVAVMQDVAPKAHSRQRPK